MAGAFEVLGLAFIVIVHSALAALLTRFFRVRLKTNWGSAFYVGVCVPFVLLVSTMLLGTVLGPDLGSATAVVGVTVAVPVALGVSFDYFWMPAPDEVDLPDQYDRNQVRRNP